MADPVLQVRGLNVYYGHSHALQGVDLTLEHGVLSVVGRNGMGKTTLCQAICGLKQVRSGTITFAGRAITNLGAAEVARMGIAYVPQGRRLWPSLTVDEHLRLAARDGAWTIDRIYSTFPRLAERKTNGGAQLSGGEQQMLAISRALLANPRLLVMDEPTEGLAPVIVTQVAGIIGHLEEEGDISVLLIEQNIRVATAAAQQTAIMVNGRVNRVMESGVLAGDRELQQRLLGVGRHGHDDTGAAEPEADAAPERAEAGPRRIYLSNPQTPTRWSQPVPVRVLERNARTVTEARRREEPQARPLTATGRPVVLVAGTLDTKGAELRFIRDILKEQGLPVRLVDLSTSGKPSGAEVPPTEIAAWHPRGAAGVFTGDRGASVAAMTLAFERWIRRQEGVAGIISAGGSGGTALATPAMRALPVGVPKVMISTVASGNVGQYVGPADIMMLYSVADVQGLNRITRAVLSNGAHALAGMVKARQGKAEAAPEKPAVGITMFGVTTTAVQSMQKMLEADHDVLVFHATGTGGQAMEKLVELAPAGGRHRPHHHRGLRHDDGRRLRRDRRTASAPSSAPACPMSARSARSTW